MLRHTHTHTQDRTCRFFSFSFDLFFFLPLAEQKYGEFPLLPRGGHVEYLNSRWKRGQAREVAMQTAIHDILITIPLTSYFLQNELSNCYSRDVSRFRVPPLERDFVAFNCETCFAIVAIPWWYGFYG